MKQDDMARDRKQTFAHQDEDGCVSHEGTYIETFGQPQAGPDDKMLPGTHLHAPLAEENKRAARKPEEFTPFMEGVSDGNRPAIRLDVRTAREGMILSEVLGAPVSRRRRRF